MPRDDHRQYKRTFKKHSRSRSRSHQKTKSSYTHQRQKGQPFKEDIIHRKETKDQNDNYKNQRVTDPSHSVRNGKEKEEEKEKEKEMPCWEPSGILAEFNNNSKSGQALKHSKPQDEAIPSNSTWRLYVFKGDEEFPAISLKGKSTFLFGKNASVADILLDNPTVSAQHAVVQFRHKAVQDELTGDVFHDIKPYVMDLESTNGTFLNGDRIEPAKYYEIRDKDVLRFGSSNRDYIVMNIANTKLDASK